MPWLLARMQSQNHTDIDIKIRCVSEWSIQMPYVGVAGSRENHGILLVYKVLVEAPCHNASEAFARNTRQKASKVAHKAISLVNLHERVHYAAVVLRLVLVMILKVLSGAY